MYRSRAQRSSTVDYSYDDASGSIHTHQISVIVCLHEASPGVISGQSEGDAGGAEPPTAS